MATIGPFNNTPETIAIAQSAVNAARPAISNEITTKINTSVNSVSAGIINLKPGEVPPANINTVNLALGTYTSLGGLIVTQAELDSGIVQARKNQSGVWEKFIIPVTGLDKFVEKTGLFEGELINSFDPTLVQADTVFDTATGTIIASTTGRVFTGLQPAQPNTKYKVLNSAGPIYMFNAAREFVAYSQATAHNAAAMQARTFIQASIYTVNSITEFTTNNEIAFISANGIVGNTADQVKASVVINSTGTVTKIKKELLPADLGEATMLDGVTKSPTAVVIKEIQNEFASIFEGGSAIQVFDPNGIILNTLFNTDTALVETSTSGRVFSGYTTSIPGQEYTVLKGSGPVYFFDANKNFVAYVSNQVNNKVAMQPFTYVPALEYTVNEITRFIAPTGAAFFGVNTITGSTPDQVKLQLKIYRGNALQGTKKIKADLLPAGTGGGGGGTSYMDRLAGTVKAYNRGTGVPGNGSILRFNFAFCSDIHYDSTNSDLNLKELIDFTNHPLIKDDTSAIFCGGDICNGQYGRTKSLALAEINNFTTRALQSGVPFLNIVGNHDDNISWTGKTNPTSTFAQALTKIDQHNLLIKPFADKYSNIVRVTNKAYFHADFADHKIRVIGTDAYEWPLVNTGNGSIKYKSSIAGQYFSQAQLDWLQTTLAATPAGYAVIVLTHCPVRSGLTWSNGFVQGTDMLPRIINAWKNGTSYNHSYTNGTFPELNTSKNFSFTGSGKEFICYLGGHVHSLINYVTEAFPDQHGVVVPCMWTSGAGSGDAEETPTMVRGENEEIRNSFAYMSVDRYRKNLIVTMYGAHKDGEGFITNRTNIIKYNV